MTFDDFWRLYYNRLIADLVGFGRLPQDAEELAGDALRKTWQKIDKIKPEARWVYLRTAGRREAINHHRNANTRRRDAARTVSLDDFRDAVQVSTPEDEAIARQAIAQLHADIRAVLDELPAESRLFIVLRHRNNSYEDIAEKLGVRLPTVQSRLYRTTQRFAERLGPPPEGLTWIELAGELIDDHEE
jgi:RNA polymerase sigma factor (sigma-70 family)